MIELGWKSYMVGFFIMIFAIFMNYPPPPQSPIVYQWRTGGNFFTFKGYEIFYKVDEGNGNGQLICLHGFPTSSFDFYKLLPQLKKRFKTVIFLDFLGFGFSDKPRHHHYSIMEQTDLVEHLLHNILNISSINVLAHDYGDTVAQELIARNNDKTAIVKIDSVCLMNGGIFPSHHKPIFIQTLLRVPVVGTILSRFGNFYFFQISLTKVFGPNSQPSRAELNDFWTLVRYKDGYRVLGSLLGYIDDRLQYEDRWVGALRKSEVKIHMIYGKLDPINPPPFEKHYRSIIHNPSIDVLDNSSHYPQLEFPNKEISSCEQGFIINEPGNILVWTGLHSQRTSGMQGCQYLRNFRVVGILLIMARLSQAIDPLVFTSLFILYVLAEFSGVYRKSLLHRKYIKTRMLQ